LALFSASGGVNNLITAVNVAYDEEDSRNPIKKRLLALALTLGAIVFIVVMLGLVAVVPALLQTVFGDDPVIRFALRRTLDPAGGARDRRSGGAVPRRTRP